MLNINQITVRYEKLTAVEDAVMKLEKGKIHGLIGPNGAGKSSLINVCTGLISEFEGQVIYGEMDVRENRQWVKEHVGVAPEDTRLMPYLTGREFLKLIHTIKCRSNSDDETKRFIQLLGLESKIDDLIIELSHGMRQKLLLASAFIGNPQYLIIDEALNGLDPIALHNVRGYLQEICAKGVTILISSHVLPLVREWCATIHLMHQGKIIKRFTKSQLDEIEKKEHKNISAIFMEVVRGN